jgi:Zn-dependent peptidase ImmA (M78 family)
MLTDIPTEQLSRAIEWCARELLAEADIDRPPVDTLLLAERLGLVVAHEGAAQQRARFVRLAAVSTAEAGTILLADEPRPERRQWAVAHEIGEFAAHRVFSFLGIPLSDIPPHGREQIANHLANALLLPGKWFRNDGACVNWDLWELKQIYSTASHELIARRMLEMPVPVIVTLFDQGRPVWRKSNVLRRPPPLTPAEQATWRHAHVVGEPTCYESPLAGEPLLEAVTDIRCWPVHEPDWQREILRTGLEEW